MIVWLGSVPVGIRDESFDVEPEQERKTSDHVQRPTDRRFRARSERERAAPGERPESAAVSRRPTALLARPELERLSQRTNVHGLAYFVGRYALIGLGGWLCWLTFPDPLFWPVFAFQAVVTGFLFSPLHECAHGSAFRSRGLNEAVLRITALVYVVPPYYFRYFHLGHRRFTQAPGKDPSLVLPEPANFGQYLWYCAGLWFWWRNLSWMVKHACGFVHPASATYVPAGRRGLMVIESRIMVLLYAALFALAAYFGFAWVLMVAWIAPRVAGEPIQRIIRVAEHVGCDESPDLLRNTRTTLANRFVNAIAWQMPYHAEHHLFPNLPFHALPAAHALVGDRVVVEPRGYLAGQRQIIRRLLQAGSTARPEGKAQAPLL